MSNWKTNISYNVWFFLFYQHVWKKNGFVYWTIRKHFQPSLNKKKDHAFFFYCYFSYSLFSLCTSIIKEQRNETYSQKSNLHLILFENFERITFIYVAMIYKIQLLIAYIFCYYRILKTIFIHTYFLIVKLEDKYIIQCMVLFVLSTRLKEKRFCLLNN